MKKNRRNRKSQRRRQRQLRKRRGERAFLFDAELSRCLGEVDREEWEFAISMGGGDLASAAEMCGLEGVLRNAKALWGRSAEEALATYRSWLKRRRK